MLKALVVSLRPAQWSKNLFVLAPLVFAGGLSDPTMAGRGLLAFAVWSGAASSVYLLNDLRDRGKDRLHPLKRLRPIATGALSPAAASAVSLALAGGALGGALYLGTRFGVFLLGYLVLNVLYSFGLKNVVILDVMAVAFGYVLRVEGGAAAIGVEVSTWILLCTTFVALFLAFSKRRHELLLLSENAAHQRGVLIHYGPTFLDQMINVVTASTLISYALYTLAPETADKFGTPGLTYTLPFVLFGIFRYLYLVYQVTDERNPTEAILRDLPSVLNVALWGLAVVAIIYLT
ncbi:MAG TPA: decaprenyl-phosphate phosphoribosyltransferase [Thermoanaerobaculia bacterium]|nr:decaprenyl-phosphate phosphoribosyltransferase [Thermoanaerobaculia bacterium]